MDLQFADWPDVFFRMSVGQEKNKNNLQQNKQTNKTTTKQQKEKEKKKLFINVPLISQEMVSFDIFDVVHP